MRVRIKEMRECNDPVGDVQLTFDSQKKKKNKWHEKSVADRHEKMRLIK